ncbi:DUF551 domain-containing protein [Escherichia coli]|nr:DUF551 domain-containing protein [Escherichia coli]ELM7795845.1 DUF551 domain-containing protein [Escherichia coli]ELM7805796.1 DUF551 domain-containing protein [Escherichia coli]ELM7810068.1 DUF551 domain-containing protein [Escherichia coli]ELM7815402.1 DUF551 domain-containing protein [Escherichia coli]
MTKFTKEQLQEIIETDNVQCGEASELARIALASLEAKAVCVIDQSNLDYLKSGSDADVWPASRAEMGDVLLYRSATPAPVSVPAAMEMDDDFDSAFEHGKAVGWNAYRAAMLQGADQPQNAQQNIPENIPTLRDGIEAIRNSGIAIDAERIQAERDALNSPVIPDGWVACSERMPEVGVKVLCFPVNDEPIHATYNGQVWLQDISWSVSDEPIDNVISCNVFHWMPLPAAPQQEADNG